MRPTLSLLLSVVCATVLACAPAVAHAAQQGAAPSPPQPQTGQLTLPPQQPHLTSEERDAQLTIQGAYRLTYTLTDMDGSRNVGYQHYAILLDANAKASLKLGTKVPIATGQAYENPSNQQISYIDIGLNIDSRLRQFANGLELSTHVVQSTLDTQQSDTKDPVIRATDLQSSVLLNEDKPVVLGTLDTPGSTHRLEVKVELTRLR